VASISFNVGEFVDVTELMAIGLVAGDAFAVNGSIPSYFGICTGELGHNFILQQENVYKLVNCNQLSL